ncbi:MAG: hypothetical protein M5U27_10075 [Gaiella sp.]|nr:hypothetical protein [Gaiella sp.]
MSKRLQVILSDDELREVRRAARRKRVTVSEWVRRALRAAREAESGLDTGDKLAAVRAATAHSYPSGEIEQILAEIERGYVESR